MGRVCLMNSYVRDLIGVLGTDSTKKKKKKTLVYVGADDGIVVSGSQMW